jgi:hypothetical protein
MTSTHVLTSSAAAVLCLALAGCSGTLPPASAERTPATNPAPSWSPSTCTPALVLGEVDQLLAGQEFAAHYLTIGDKLTLSVWLVDPEIDPETTQPGVVAAGREALARGLAIAYQMVDRIPCTEQAFDEVNPMIVDARFQHWYKDFLPVGAFVGLRDPTTDDLIAAVEATGTALETPRTTAPPAARAAAGSCTWADARATIQAYFAAESNTAAYLIIGAGLVDQGALALRPPEDIGVEVQWPVQDMRQASDPAVLGHLQPVAQALVCLSPSVDSLEAFVVDRSGRTVVYAVVPGSAIPTGAHPQLGAGVRIYHPLPWRP